MAWCERAAAPANGGLTERAAAVRRLNDNRAMRTTWLLTLLLALPLAARAAEPPTIVFAAASLKDALDEARGAFGAEVSIAYAATPALAKQIENGAPAELFVSADREWMDALERAGLLRAGTRVDLIGNALVLVAPRDSMLALRVAPDFALAAALGDGRLALADPRAVPAGRYAKAALETLGVWSAVAERVAPAENVRAALRLVARGEAPLGIVYASDARDEPAVRVVDTIPASAHPPIVYPAALLPRAGPRAAALLEFLRGERARAIFVRHGFRALP
jgi:molybdate transport system substrate-binding protein